MENHNRLTNQPITKRISLDLIRHVRGRGPSIARSIEYIKSNRMIISPSVYSFENYYLCIEESNIIAAYKKLGHSSVDCIIAGNEEKALVEIQKIMRETMRLSDFGGKNIAATINQLERVWIRVTKGTSFEDKFYDHLAQAVGIKKEILQRGMKTREPSGITKEDLGMALEEIKTGASKIKKIDKLADRFCPYCGNVENLKIANTDITILPHYVAAASLSKISHMTNSVPYAAREATLKLIRDGVQRLIAKTTKTKLTTDEDTF